MHQCESYFTSSGTRFCEIRPFWSKFKQTLAIYSWTIKNRPMDPYKYCFYCSATHVTSQGLKSKSVNKWYRGPHTFNSVHLAQLAIVRLKGCYRWCRRAPRRGWLRGRRRRWRRTSTSTWRRSSSSRTSADSSCVQRTATARGCSARGGRAYRLTCTEGCFWNRMSGFDVSVAYFHCIFILGGYILTRATSLILDEF